MLILLVDQSCDNENWQFLAKNQFFGRCGFFFSHPQTFESHKTCVGEANEGFWGLRK